MIINLLNPLTYLLVPFFVSSSPALGSWTQGATLAMLKAQRAQTPLRFLNSDNNCTFMVILGTFCDLLRAHHRCSDQDVERFVADGRSFLSGVRATFAILDFFNSQMLN